jgi:hypothetical protein
LATSESERNQIINQLEQFRLTTKTFVEKAAAAFFQGIVQKIPQWVQGYQVQEPIKLREILVQSAHERVGSEVAHFLTNQLSLAYKEWQESVLFPQLNSLFEKQIEELEASLQTFASGLESLRLESDIDAPTSGRRSGIQKDIEHLLLKLDNLSIDNIDIAAFGALFGSGRALLSLAPLTIATPLVLLLSWNPLILVPAALAGIIFILGIGGAPAITNKIVRAVSQQYESKFTTSLVNLSSAAARDLETMLTNYQNDLNQRLSLKIQNIRDQVNAVIVKKEEGQAAVDQELSALSAIKAQLNTIEDELRELLEEAIKEM